MKQIVVPALGESITEATLASIKKNVGESVKCDETLFELETDKVTLEVNSPSDGVIASLSVNVGDNVEIGALLGTIKEGQVASKPAEDIKLHEKQDAPAAKAMMAENNLKREEITATGKDGRVTKSDVMQTMANKVPAPVLAPVAATTDLQKVKRVKMSKLRQKIAQRLKESQNTAAILSTFNEIDMQGVMALRAKYKDLFQKKYAIKLGFMSFFLKAVIAALKEIPDLNAEICGDEIIYKNYYDIGVAVGTEQGLVVPVIRNADKLSIAEIESEIFRLGTKARDGKLTLQEMQGGTFTISNGGVYGSLLSTPIINPPQSGILGMHTIQKRPVVIDDKIEIRPMMYVALSYDHRIVDGKGAVTFLVKLKQYIEDPQRLLIDL